MYYTSFLWYNDGFTIESRRQMQAKATPEAVKAAIETLLAEGREVSVSNVHAITGGSRSTVIKEIGAWREAQKTAAPKPAEKATATTVQEPRRLARLSAAIEAVQAAALDDLNDAVQAVEDRAAQTIRAANDAADVRVKDTESKAEQRVADAIRERDEAVRERDAMATAADDQEVQAEELRQSILDLNTKLDDNARAIQALTDENGALTAERDKIRDQYSERDREYWKTRAEMMDLRRRAEVAETLVDAYKERAGELRDLLHHMAETHAITLPPLPAEPVVDDVQVDGDTDQTDEGAAGSTDAPKQRRRPWTDADDEVLRAIAERGGTQAEAAKELGRPDGIVSEKWRALGLPVPPRKGRVLGPRKAGDETGQD